MTLGPMATRAVCPDNQHQTRRLLCLFIICIFWVKILVTLSSAEKNHIYVRVGFGVRMCEELCTYFGQCQRPWYSSSELKCYLTKPVGFFGKSVISLAVQLSDIKKDFHRMVISHSKRKVFIKGNGKCPKLRRMPIYMDDDCYMTLLAGKQTTRLKRHQERLTWKDARRACQTEGGELVKVDTKEIHFAIKKYLSKPKDTFQLFFMWIGLTDQDDESHFQWTDGTPLRYSNWHRQEPSNTKNKKKAVDEDCVVYSLNTFYGLHWNDISCTTKNGFICEKSRFK